MAERQPTEDDAAGMAWWNALPERDRKHWLRAAGSAVAADAWALFKQWEPVTQQAGGIAWFATYPVGGGVDDLRLSVHEDAGSWWWDIDHSDAGTLAEGERETQAEAMAAALDAAPQVARDLAANMTD